MTGPDPTIEPNKPQEVSSKKCPSNSDAQIMRFVAADCKHFVENFLRGKIFNADDAE